MPDLALRGVPRDVQQLDAGYRAEVRVIGIGPHHLLAWRHLDDVRGLPKMPVAQPVCHDRVAVGQALEACHEFKADAGKVATLDRPNGLPKGVHLEYARRAAGMVGAGDQRVSAGKADRGVRPARRGDRADDFPGRIVFAVFFKDTAPTEIFALSLPDALPI